jgi:hypothetical protein
MPRYWHSAGQHSVILPSMKTVRTMNDLPCADGPRLARFGGDVLMPDVRHLIAECSRNARSGGWVYYVAAAAILATPHSANKSSILSRIQRISCTTWIARSVVSAASASSFFPPFVKLLDRGALKGNVTFGHSERPLCFD